MSLAKNWSLAKIEDEILRIVKDETQQDEGFTKTTRFEDVGFDSLSLVRVLVGIDYNLGVWLEADLQTPENLRDVKCLALCIQTVLKDG